MRAVILAAGYGTRLERDLKNDKSGKYDHLIGVPKPLLPIGSLPLITHWIRAFSEVPEISSVVVVINDLHKKMYEKWAEDLVMKVTLVSDGTTSNESRSGAVACMALGVQDSQEDTLFIAGDTLLKDFLIKSMISKFEDLRRQDPRSCIILSAPVAEENVSKHGIIEVAETGRVTKFVEKPQPSETASRLQCPCLYILSSHSHIHLKKFLQERKEEPLITRDATGTFITELIQLTPVFAHHVSGRYDVGGLQSYLDCHQDFLQ